MRSRQVEESAQIVTHHEPRVVVIQVLQLTEVHLGLGEPFTVREVGPEHDRLDADRLDHPVDVLLGERRDEAVVLEVLTRAPVERPPRRAPAHEERVVELADRVRHPHRALLGQEQLHLREPREPALEDRGADGLHRRTVAVVEGPLERVHVAQHHLVLAPVEALRAVPGDGGEVGAELDAGFAAPRPEAVVLRSERRRVHRRAGRGLDHLRHLELHDLVEQHQRAVGIGERDERRREQPALVVVTPLRAEVAVERNQVGVEAVEVVLELHLHPRQRGVVDRALDALRVHHREPIGRVVELLLQVAVVARELLAAHGVEVLERVQPREQ